MVKRLLINSKYIFGHDSLLRLVSISTLLVLCQYCVTQMQKAETAGMVSHGAADQLIISGSFVNFIRCQVFCTQ